MNKLNLDRSQLIEDNYPGLPGDGFARGVIECYGAHAKESCGDPSTEFLRKSLVVGRKIARYARSKLRDVMNSQETQSNADTSDDAISDQDDDTQEYTPECSRQRLIGDITPGGLSFMAMQLVTAWEDILYYQRVYIK